jgi:tripartite-type tricarboxylate transporter receptor subunit TctC
VGLAAWSAAGLGVALAQDAWPTRPVKLMHGFAPGGGVDLTARLLAQQLQERLGQTVVVEGRPGAGGMVASAAIAAAPADGYTLYLMASGHSIAPALNPNLSFDPVRDFTAVSVVTRLPFGIAVPAASPHRTVQELLEAARASAGKVSLGHAGLGTGMHLAGALMQQKTRIRFNEIPYRGGSLAPTAAAAGEIDAVIDNLASMDALTQAGKLRLLAVTSRERWPGAPQVPTLGEAVSPGFDVSGWYAVAGPKNLPAPVVSRLSAELRRIMATPEVMERLRKLGLGATFLDPGESQALLAAEVARWAQLVREQNIKAGP